MESNITIRPAKTGDAGRICEINRESLGYDFPMDRTQARLSHILASADCVLVACCGEDVIGYIHGSSYECIYSESLKDILGLAVDSPYWHRGVGRMLLSALEGWAKADGCAGIRLVSGVERHEAHQFYQRCGYTYRKDQKNFIKYL